MRVENFECQIAQSQMSRYLGGEGLSKEALRQLNGHMSGCEDCKRVLNERKATLLTMLGPAPTEAVVQVETTPPSTAPSLRDKLQQQLTQAAAKPTAATEGKPTAPAKATFTKPVVLSLALALVMVAMSYLAKNPTAVFGDKALSTPMADAALPPAEETPKPTTTVEPAPKAEKPEPTPPLEPKASSQEAKPVKAPAAQEPTKAPKPVATKATVAKPAAKPRHRRASRVAPRAKTPTSRPSNGIRVYDAAGRPL